MNRTTQHQDPLRIARAAILNGVPVPPVAAAQLEARGVDVGALEIRLRQNFEFRR
jgi:hypothetical protein